MKLSVIIPCHNAAPYLAQTIGSVLEQTLPADEIIVVDDASSDESAGIARSFGERVELVSARFRCAAKSRNYGFGLATGDAIMFLDADDVLGPTVLEALVAILEKKSAGIALCEWQRVELVEGKWVTQPASVPPEEPGQDLLSGWLMGRYFPPCCVLWSRDAYQQVGGWDEEAGVIDDGDLMMRALIQGISLGVTGDATAYYRRIPGGQSLSGTRRSEAGAWQNLRTLRKVTLMLEERGIARRYRRALGHAFRQLAADCDGHPDLRSECEEYARRYGESPGITVLREKRKWWLARVRRVAKRIAGKSLEPPPHEPREVTHGRRPVPAAGAKSQGRPFSRRISQAPAVSVIIPTYNRAHLIERATRSVLNQSFADFEVLVVDDGSTDATGEVVAKMGDDRIRYLLQPRNAGVSAARNRGLRESKGEFIAFLDSDDEWMPEKMEEQVALFRRAPATTGVVYTSVQVIAGRDAPWIFPAKDRGDVYRKLLHRNFILSGSTVMLRRNVIRSSGFFDEGIPAIEDYDYWTRTARLHHFDFIEEPMVRYFDAHDEARKSLHTTDNLQARAWFFRKHRREMSRAGVAHLFLLESAQRHFQARDPWAARRLALQALWHRPKVYEPYSYLARITLPQGVHRTLSRRRRSNLGSA